ncbi:hypothetical protein [Geopseudomonas aromaticivorans]
MQSLRIRISISTPLIEPAQAFHFDALLGALRVKQAEEEQGAIDPRSVHHDLPLDRYVTPSGEWVFKASAFRLHREGQVIPWMMSGRSNLARVAEDRESGFLKLRAAKANIAGGPFKGTIFNVNLVWAELEAWAVGDPVAIEQLLARCHQIGGRRGVGHGQVQGFSVEPVEPEECHWDWRALPPDFDQPLTHDEPLVLAIGNLRAPYWDRRLNQDTLLPAGL